MTPNPTKFTSVIVAYNDADTIAACLDSVLGQAYLLNETIVVCDQGSSDETEAKVREILTKESRKFEIVATPHTGRSAARNTGWRRGSGNATFFADADDVYRSDYLTKAAEALKDETVGCVCITGSSLVEGKSMASRMLKVYSLVQVESRRRSKFKPTWAWVYTRKALEKVGGFDEELSQAEDKDIFERVTRLGFGVAVVEGVHWFHRRPTSNTSYFRKTYRGGVNRIPYIKKRRDYLGYVKATAVFWLLGAGLIFQLGFPFAFLTAVVVLALYVAFKGVSTAYMVWREIPSKLDLLFYPFFSLASHTVGAVGEVMGLLGHQESSSVTSDSIKTG